MRRRPQHSQPRQNPLRQNPLGQLPLQHSLIPSPRPNQLLTQSRHQLVRQLLKLRQSAFKRLDSGLQPPQLLIKEFLSHRHPLSCTWPPPLEQALRTFHLSRILQ